MKTWLRFSGASIVRGQYFSLELRLDIAVCTVCSDTWCVGDTKTLTPRYISYRICYVFDLRIELDPRKPAANSGLCYPADIEKNTVDAVQLNDVIV